jgi:cardiolipin synthase
MPRTRARAVTDGADPRRQRGVKVRVLVDWFGTGHRAACRLREEPSARPACTTACSIPGSSAAPRAATARSRDRPRDAFVGGINTNDDNAARLRTLRAAAGAALGFRGARAAGRWWRIHREGQAQWTRAGHLPLVHRIDLFRETRKQPPPLGEHPMRAGFVVRDNLRNRRTIQRAYLQAIGRRASGC